jgi:hypothetical protein
MPSLLLPLLVICSALKPEFIVYAAIFLFIGKGFAKQLAYGAVTVLATVLLLFADYRAEGAYFLDWLERLHGVRFVFVQGHGILAVLEVLGIQAPLAEIAVYTPCAALILLAARLVCDRCRLPPRPRALLGVSACLLVYPRLLDYDQYTLPFGLAVLAACLPRIGLLPESKFLPLFWGSCLLCAAIGGVRGGTILYVLSLVLLAAVALGALRRDPAPEAAEMA